ncbi:hypothetical protein GCM10023215_28960 [Pseudonocardia yuanmonensis]|uniref:Oligomerization/nucleic acid binding protein n=1 Tax=Pseudonocardia yuanmonensis TaxID=1095914 RepID=A0ABP8WIR3_9PSEU
MPGLLRGIARTAIVAGTASSVAGRVQRRQARKFADRDAEIAAQRERAYEEQMAPPAPYPAAAPAPAPGGGTDVITQLKELAQLREQGVLTDDEFAAQKARILG